MPRAGYVIVISLSTVEYTSVSRVYSTVDSDITNLIQDRLCLSLCALKREEVRRQGQTDYR